MNNFKRKLLIKIVPLLSTLYGHPLPPVASAGAIIKNKNKILAIDLSYKKGYSIPGGALSPGENFEEGVRREVKEETNLEVTSLKYLSSKGVVTNNFGQVSVCFLAKVKDIKNIKSSDEGEILWLEPEKLYKNCSYVDVKKHLKNYYKF